MAGELRKRILHSLYSSEVYEQFVEEINNECDQDKLNMSTTVSMGGSGYNRNRFLSTILTLTDWYSTGPLSNSSYLDIHAIRYNLENAPFTEENILDIFSNIREKDEPFSRKHPSKEGNREIKTLSAPYSFYRENPKDIMSINLNKNFVKEIRNAASFDEAIAIQNSLRFESIKLVEDGIHFANTFTELGRIRVNDRLDYTSKLL